MYETEPFSTAPSYDNRASQFCEDRWNGDGYPQLEKAMLVIVMHDIISDVSNAFYTKGLTYTLNLVKIS